MTPIWRYLTKPAGMTAKELAEATGMTIQAVRADLVELEAQDKIVRARAAVGKPHVWWRIGKRPLEGEDALTIIAVAAEIHESPAKLKEVLASVAARVMHAGLRKIITMCLASQAPHQIVRLSVINYEPESFSEALRAA